MDRFEIATIAWAIATVLVVLIVTVAVWQYNVSWLKQGYCEYVTPGRWSALSAKCETRPQ